jgi:polysaccharide chain length determinant protein (PEP-CTERM system associated)
MSVQFRQRTPGEYARIIWKRKWLILLPTLAIASAITWVVFRLPDIYQSSTLIVVRPSAIPDAVVPAASEETLTRQLTAISQYVTSRSSLQPLIEKYRLYEVERMRNEPMEMIIDRMRRDIKVELNTSRNDITNGFNISYKGRDQRTTQLVTSELAGKYIDAHAKNSSDAGKGMTNFFEQQLTAAKEELDAIDRKRLEFMQQNLPNLPTDQAALIGQLSGLYENQKALYAEIGRLREQSTVQSARLGDLRKQREQEIENVSEAVGDPKKTPEYLELSKRESDVDAEVRYMEATLREKNPDLIKKKGELAAIKTRLQQIVEDGKAKIEEKRKKYEAMVDPRINEVKYTIQFIDGEIKRQQKMLDDTNSQISGIQGRLNAVPGAQVGLQSLDREYQSKKVSYDALLAQKEKADLIAGMQTNQQGESIAVVDPANLPERPVAPKRPMLIIMGLLLGLFVGLAFASLFEVPRLLTIQTTNDAEHYTGLPVLVAVPELLTPQEARRIPARRRLLLAAGIVVTLVSIPALAYALKLSNILEKFVS